MRSRPKPATRPTPDPQDEPHLKTSVEIETAVSHAMGRFEPEYMGQGPRVVKTDLIGDMLVVRLQGVLTPAEQRLVKKVDAEKGRELLKQLRVQLMEAGRPIIEAMIHEITGVKAQSLHHDICTSTGDEIVIVTLKGLPHFLATKDRHR